MGAIHDPRLRPLVHLSRTVCAGEAVGRRELGQDGAEPHGVAVPDKREELEAFGRLREAAATTSATPAAPSTSTAWLTPMPLPSSLRPAEAGARRGGRCGSMDDPFARGASG